MCCVTLLRVTASSPSRRTTRRSTGSLGPSALCWRRLTVATDAVSSSQATPPRSAPFERTPAASLTQRASLNVAASLLDYAAKVAVGFLVVPVLVSGLGRSLYGVWEMLGRLVGYMSARDGRPTQALRLVVANLQASPDDRAKRPYVGASLLVWLLFLPLTVLLGGALIWFAPAITKVAPTLHPAIRATCALLVVALLFANLASLPESVLRGMNLGYKRMGLQALLEVVGGALTAGAGYVGLGVARGAGAPNRVFALPGFCLWVVVKENVRWFRGGRPARPAGPAVVRVGLWG